MCGNTQIAAGNFHKHIKKVIKYGPQTHLNEFENQFKVRTLDMIFCSYMATEFAFMIDCRCLTSYLLNQGMCRDLRLFKILQRTAITTICPVMQEIPSYVFVNHTHVPVLVGDDWRVLLRENYIHAAFVNVCIIILYRFNCNSNFSQLQGYKQQRAFIIAQSPMESTARDFWKMIYDRKCGVIVMLCDLMEDGEV